MRESTKRRYQRIQHFNRRLSKARLSYEFRLGIIKDFFNMEDNRTIEKIIVKELDQTSPYIHQDLDDIWIDGRIRKHYAEIAPTTIELNNQEQIEE